MTALRTRLLPGRRDGLPALAEAVSRRLAALDDVLEAGRDRLDPDAVAAVEELVGKASERLRFAAGNTVVALAGTTGSGKSTLFNALAGTSLSTVGMRRPTTGQAHAASWGTGDTDPLLDWLDVPRRHRITESAGWGETEPAGLVLLDLPDVDSVQVGHRLEVDRLVGLVDLLVWVVDPQKYADAALHDRYLSQLGEHADVTLVAFNQIDRLPPAGRTGVLADLEKLLRTDGLAGVPVLPVSARTGEGLAALRDRLGAAVEAREASLRRLDADLDALVSRLTVDIGANRKKDAAVNDDDRGKVVAALTDAAGAPAVTRAVARSYRTRTRAAAGWPFTRWLGRFRPDAARRLGLPQTPSELVRTALPGPSPVQDARIDSALRSLSDRVGAGLPDPWPGAVRRATVARRADLPDLLDRAVAGADLGIARSPRWWAVARLVQFLLALSVVVGAVWLLVLFGLDWLRLPEPPLPSVGRLPLPTVLLVGGALAGLVVAWICARLGAFGARRRARAAGRTLRTRVTVVAEDAVLTPVEVELAAHRKVRAALDRAAH